VCETIILGSGLLLKDGDSLGNVGTMVSEPRKGLYISQQRVERESTLLEREQPFSAGFAMQISSNGRETN
jgi:hypothetical protein